jgi:hypothetical protein
MTGCHQTPHGNWEWGAQPSATGTNNAPGGYSGYHSSGGFWHWSSGGNSGGFFGGESGVSRGGFGGHGFGHGGGGE